ncbi:Hypothetical_protein [Hexamita inflata]|uniref:Hypothetical_protein n=1 Tax=Hexamita inflata TaxID=28002 RepID=A0AA86R8N7_9EUKA|nr:Hypothetical protein HINF_LOCUS61474 [Hexamita inflata]
MIKGIEEQKKLFVEDQLNLQIVELVKQQEALRIAQAEQSAVMQAIAVSAQQLDNERQQLADRILREEEEQRVEEENIEVIIDEDPVLVKCDQTLIKEKPIDEQINFVEINAQRTKEDKEPQRKDINLTNVEKIVEKKVPNTEIEPVNAKRVKKDKSKKNDTVEQSPVEAAPTEEPMISTQQAIDDLYLMNCGNHMPYEQPPGKDTIYLPVKKQIIRVTLEQINDEIKFLFKRHRTTSAKIKCQVEGCEYSFNEAYDYLMHYQTNYKSHDISKISNVNDLLRKELQRKKLNFYTTCSYCSCPFMDITSALKHQKKCVFQNTILRNDQSDSPQHEGRDESAPENEHEDIQEDEEEDDQENQDREEGNPNNPNRPTIVRATYTKKAYQDNIHEMSKECNDTDQDALSMRVNEVLMQFTANPNQAGNLIRSFRCHSLRVRKVFRLITSLNQQLKRKQISSCKGDNQVKQCRQQKDMKMMKRLIISRKRLPNSKQKRISRRMWCKSQQRIHLGMVQQQKDKPVSLLERSYKTRQIICHNMIRVVQAD